MILTQARVLAKGTYYIKLTSISFSWEDDSEAISFRCGRPSISSLTVTGTSAGFLLKILTRSVHPKRWWKASYAEDLACHFLRRHSQYHSGTVNGAPTASRLLLNKFRKWYSRCRGTKLAAGSYGIYFTMDSVTTSSPACLHGQSPGYRGFGGRLFFTSSAGTTLPAAKTVGSIKDISAAFTVSDYRKTTA